MKRKLILQITDKTLEEIYSDLVPCIDDIIILSSGKYKVIGREILFSDTIDRIKLKLVKI